MVNISKKKLKPEIERAVLREFLNHVARRKDSSETQEFLYEFLTSSERIQLAKRFAIVIMLLRGYSFAQIQKMLKVSPSTVALQWRNLKQGKHGRMRIADILHGRHIPESSLFESLLKLLAEGPPPRVGKGRWKFLKKPF